MIDLSQLTEEELKHKFEEWFYDNLTPYTFRCEWAYGDIGTECIETREKNMKQWLMSAYCAGYERAQYETLEELKHKFEEWFYDNLTPYTFRCEWAYGDIGTECIETREKNMKQWLMSAYCAGYERAQYETLEVSK